MNVKRLANMAKASITEENHYKHNSLPDTTQMTRGISAKHEVKADVRTLIILIITSLPNFALLAIFECGELYKFCTDFFSDFECQEPVSRALVLVEL